MCIITHEAVDLRLDLFHILMRRKLIQTHVDFKFITARNGTNLCTIKRVSNLKDSGGCFAL
jgi:hypothetical protein